MILAFSQTDMTKTFPGAIPLAKINLAFGQTLEPNGDSLAQAVKPCSISEQTLFHLRSDPPSSHFQAGSPRKIRASPHSLAFLSIPQGRHAEMPAKMAREGTLIVKAEVERNLADRRGAVPQGLAGGLDAGLDEKGLRTDAKDGMEAAVEAAHRQAGDLGERGDRYRLAEMRPQPRHRAVELGIARHRQPAISVALHCADDAHRRAIGGEHRILVGQKPIGQTLPVEEQLDDLELRLTGGEHFLVVAAESLGQPCRKQGKIIPADEIALRPAAQPLPKDPIGRDEAEGPILGEKSHSREGIKKLQQLLARRDGIEECLFQRIRTRGWRMCGHGRFIPN